jgi:enoyl-CoA hydratase
VADIGTLQRLPGLIGQQRCRELAYTGRSFNGEEAEKIGLVAKSFKDQDELDQHVQMVAETIAKKSPLTIRGIKKSVLYSRDHDLEDALEQVKLWNMSALQNDDLQDIFKAMMNKSKAPDFTRP